MEKEIVLIIASILIITGVIILLIVYEYQKEERKIKKEALRQIRIKQKIEELENKKDHF